MHHEQDALYRDLSFWILKRKEIEAKERQLSQQIEAELRLVDKTIETIDARLEELYWSKS
jgi:hypothetical protein